MSEEAYLNCIRRIRSTQDPDLTLALRVAKCGVKAYPHSVRLLCKLGDLLQLAGDEDDTPEEVLACYERAAKVDDQCEEAFIEIGYFHDIYTQNPEAAEAAFRRALELGRHEYTIVGLARVVAQQGKSHQEALAILDMATNTNSPRVRKLREEITAGVWAPRPNH